MNVLILAIVMLYIDNYGAFLVGNTNKTTVPNVHSTASLSIQELSTLVFEEKRLRVELEDRLNIIETNVTQMDALHDAVNKELLEERHNRQQLEMMYTNMKIELDNLTMVCKHENGELISNHSQELRQLTRQFTTLSNENLEKETKLANLTTALMIAKEQISMLENHSSVIGQQSINNQPSNRNKLSVGFTVTMASQKSVSPSNPLQMANDKFNVGKLFNTSINSFVCKQSGLYFFTFTMVTTYRGGHLYCCVLKSTDNGSILPCAVAGDATSSVYSSSTASGLMKLRKGDWVYVGECTHPDYIQ